MKILVLGAGLVGRPMALDLLEEKTFEISVCDISAERLNKLDSTKFKLIQADMTDLHLLTQSVKDYDIVLNALPGSIGYQTTKTIIMAGKDMVDISFFPEDPFDLVDLTAQMNVTAVIDCGVAPGMSYTLVGYVDSILDKTEKLRIYVGGLPKIRQEPWEYKAVFSPADVIEEYTRPARMKLNNKIVIKEALSDSEILCFNEAGNLEAFNTDGLRSLLQTIECPDMVEKTLRYPSYVQKIKLLKDTGFFDTEPLDFNGLKLSPLEMTCRLLFPQWKLEEDDEDLTVMQVLVEGVKDGKRLRYTYDLYDEYDKDKKIHSMARTTGYTATTVVRMITSGMLEEKALIFPEHLGKHEVYVNFLLTELRKKGINYIERIEEL